MNVQYSNRKVILDDDAPDGIGDVHAQGQRQHRFGSLVKDGEELLMVEEAEDAVRGGGGEVMDSLVGFGEVDARAHHEALDGLLLVEVRHDDAFRAGGNLYCFADVDGSVFGGVLVHYERAGVMDDATVNHLDSKVFGRRGRFRVLFLEVAWLLSVG